MSASSPSQWAMTMIIFCCCKRLLRSVSHVDNERFFFIVKWGEKGRRGIARKQRQPDNAEALAVAYWGVSCIRKALIKADSLPATERLIAKSQRQMGLQKRKTALSCSGQGPARPDRETFTRPMSPSWLTNRVNFVIYFQKSKL